MERRDRSPSPIAGLSLMLDMKSSSPGRNITLARNFDGFCPMGPGMTTPERLVQSVLEVSCSIDGSAAVAMRFPNWPALFRRAVEMLQGTMTLEAGDIVALQPPDGGLTLSVSPGNRMRIELEGIGCLETRIVETRLGP